MSHNILLTGAAAAILSAVALPALAVDNISLNTWYTGSFTTTNTPVFGPPFATATDPTALAAPAGTMWTITLASAEPLTVVDLQTSGDVFEIFDNGVSLGDTSTPVDFGTDVCALSISCSLSNSDYSRGVFFLGAGTNVITMEYIGNVGGGDVAFAVGSAVSVPEPATWALMLAGFAGLGAALRGRRKALAAPA
jgi:hypothetical protein